MDRIATLSGWGQPHDALASIAPQAKHIRYAHHTGIPDALAAVAAEMHGYDTVIGWSLGGQLAARAIAAGMLRPKRLVLIAAPYQFVATSENALGMARDLYDKFRGNVARHPERALRKAWELVLQGDSRADQVRRYLYRTRNFPLPLREGSGEGSTLDRDIPLDIPSPQPSPSRGEGETDWLHWLDMLGGFSFNGIDLSGFPPTLLIHGDRDAVVGHEQSHCFSDAIPYAELMIMPGAGHAPHWHDAKAVHEAIRIYKE